jgi:hypothetical protein
MERTWPLFARCVVSDKTFYVHYCGGRIPGGKAPGGGGGMPRPGNPPGGGGGIPLPGNPMGGIIPGNPIMGGGIPLPAVNAAVGGGCIIPAGPTPRTGPANPGAAITGATTGNPLPATLPTPGPALILALALSAALDGGGPITVNDTIFSPRRIMRPSERRCSLGRLELSDSACLDFMGRNSSASARTMFMYLSNASNWPVMVRESWSVTRSW